MDIFNVNCSGDVDESYMTMLSGVMDGGDAGSGDGAGDAMAMAVDAPSLGA